MGFIPGEPKFLNALRELCNKHNSLLIFDEVMSGFRVGLGGAQAIYQIQPDLTALGKVIGGGLPVGAFGGKQSVMDQLAPLGPIYQAGTLSGNPLAMAAGLKTLTIISKKDYFKQLSKKLTNVMTPATKLRKLNAFEPPRIPFMFWQVLFFLLCLTCITGKSFLFTKECNSDSLETTV